MVLVRGGGGGGETEEDVGASSNASTSPSATGPQIGPEWEERSAKRCGAAAPVAHPASPPSSVAPPADRRRSNPEALGLVARVALRWRRMAPSTAFKEVYSDKKGQTHLW